MEHAGATAQRHPDLLSLAQVAVAPRGHRHWELRWRIPAAHKPARSVFGGALSGGSRQMVMAGSLWNAPAHFTGVTITLMPSWRQMPSSSPKNHPSAILPPSNRKTHISEKARSRPEAGQGTP